MRVVSGAYTGGLESDLVVTEFRLLFKRTRGSREACFGGGSGSGTLDLRWIAR